MIPHDKTPQPGVVKESMLAPSAEIATSIQRERRRDERVNTEIRVRVRRLEPKSWHSGLCVSLSAGGMALQVGQNLNVGEIVEIELQGSDGVTRTCGRVVHRSLYRYGIALIAENTIK